MFSQIRLFLTEKGENNHSMRKAKMEYLPNLQVHRYCLCRAEYTRPIINHSETDDMIARQL